MGFTQEQIETADRVGIAEILDANGERHIRHGHERKWERHDSLIFQGSKWYRHSAGEGGGAIRFCERFLNMEFADAVRYLLEGFGSGCLPDDAGQGRHGGESDEARDRGERQLILPKRNDRMKNMYRYLCGRRRIDREVVSFFVREGSLYESAERHNAVFVGLDEKGMPKSAHLRGTEDQGGRKFRMTAEGSDSCYGFGYMGAGERLYVFEAPIDLLSFLSLYRADWEQNSYLALNGVCGNALHKALEGHQNLRTAILCLDADEAGEKACARLYGEIMERYGGDEERNVEVRRLRSSLKDWNDDLVAMAEGNDRHDQRGEGMNPCSLLPV